MASTIGTARGSTHGSWRPWPRASTALPSRSTVCCALRIVAVGLKATRKTMGSPLLMPPWTPPERLVARAHAGRSASVTNGSLCSMPVRQRAGEAAADLEALRRRQRHQRRARDRPRACRRPARRARRHAARDALDHAAERVAGAARVVDARDHLLGRGRHRGSARCSPRRRPASRVRGSTSASIVVHAARPRRRTSTPRGVAQQLARDRAGRDAADRLARARAPAALPVADAVLRLVGVVRVRRAVDVLDVLVAAGRASSLRTSIAIGVPSVWPSKTPERISARSASSRGVVSLLWPGRRRSRSRWISSSVIGRRGGQPSTTTPTPPPCDSPKVVTRKDVRSRPMTHHVARRGDAEAGLGAGKRGSGVGDGSVSQPQRNGRRAAREGRSADPRAVLTHRSPDPPAARGGQPCGHGSDPSINALDGGSNRQEST